MTQPLLVFTAVPDRDAGMELLKSAVAHRLAAGGQVVHAGNVFWHLGELGTGEEWQVSLRSTSDRYPDLEAHLLAHHPWQNPEVMWVPIGGGSSGFLDWLTRETRPDPGTSS
ncbi:divalent-cation tolerance protein CutA [Actinomadura sp. WMMA1423]|uniref:divalent-cation tolerance protein CutA n=1 Tax=Actinomadura sp. WMMA1423 TaxID=2591108 RepID=UPI00114673A2|nr:divalent-cation tolerance protein CutA [Actinomadura sp. WMMA1423]